MEYIARIARKMPSPASDYQPAYGYLKKCYTDFFTSICQLRDQDVTCRLSYSPAAILYVYNACEVVFDNKTNDKFFFVELANQENVDIIKRALRSVDQNTLENKVDTAKNIKTRIPRGTSTVVTNGQDIKDMRTRRTAIIRSPAAWDISPFAYGAERCSGFGTFDDSDFDNEKRVYVNAHYGYLNMLIHELVHTFQKERLADLTETFVIDGFIDYFARLISDRKFSSKYKGLYAYNTGVIMVGEMVDEWGLKSVADFAFGRDSDGLNNRIPGNIDNITTMCKEFNYKDTPNVNTLQSRARVIVRQC